MAKRAGGDAALDAVYAAARKAVTVAIAAVVADLADTGGLTAEHAPSACGVCCWAGGLTAEHIDTLGAPWRAITEGER